MATRQITSATAAARRAFIRMGRLAGVGSRLNHSMAALMRPAEVSLGAGRPRGGGAFIRRGRPAGVGSRLNHSMAALMRPAKLSLRSGRPGGLAPAGGAPGSPARPPPPAPPPARARGGVGPRRGGLRFPCCAARARIPALLEARRAAAGPAGGVLYVGLENGG